MGDLFKKNWKKVTGVRPDEIPLSQCELARLKDILGSGSGLNIGLGGDLGGTTGAAVVEGIQGEPVSSTTPSSGELLTYNGTSWEPSPLSSTAPSSGEVLTYNGTSWEPAAPSAAAGAQVASEFRIDLPAGGSLAAKIAGATLPAGWSIVLGDDGSVDSEITAAATDIALIHSEGAFAASISLLELDTGAAPLGGYYLINTSGVGSLSKSNQLGTQFTVLGFTGLITLSRSQRILVRMLPTP